MKQDRNAVRARLLENGYEPLPLRGKACFVKGWSLAEIDEDFLREHARKAAWLNTGIRCGNVVGVDIDIGDDELADEAEAIVEAVLGPSDFCRVGRAPKRLLVYWIDDPIPKRRTGRFVVPGASRESYQVEVLGKGCQFAAIGVHPDTQRAYEWSGESPLDHDVDALPEVTAEQLEALVERLDAWFESKGLELKAEGGSSDVAGNHVECLTDDTELCVIDPGLGVMSLREIKESLPKGVAWECNFPPGIGERESWGDSGAGRIHWGPSGRLSVTDFARGAVYFEKAELGEALSILSEALPVPPDGGIFGPGPAERAKGLSDTYFYLLSDSTVRRLDAPEDSVPLASFRAAHGTRNVTQWLADARTVKARHMQFRPDRPAGLFEERGETIANSYAPPAHPEEGGELDTWREFFAHLVPDPTERELGLDWIASKAQRPWIPGHGLIMAAPRTQGTGRGTLAKIMSSLFGHHQEISFRRLVGQEYQSQYNDYLSGRLLISVPEALESLDYGARRNAYEALKEIVDPAPRPVTITRKGAPNRPEMVYASFFFATNHADALPLEAEDRRFIVLANGAPLAPELAERIYAWLGRPENIGALWRDLRARRVTYDPLGRAPETAAKRRMIEAATSDISHAWADFVAQAAGAVAVYEQWREYALSRRDELDFPRDVGRRDAGLQRVWRDHTETLGKVVRWSGRPVRPRLLRPDASDAAVWRSADHAALVGELEKNENGAAVGAVGRVVSFPER